jgi:indole-3-glycerol phosphate synthase
VSERLDSIVRATRDDLARRKARTPLRELERRASERAERRDFRAALSGPAIALIAEHKRRSPSAGVIRAGASLTDIVGAYERGGAAALSILTEREHFDGSLEDLGQARAATRLPILRKDFTIDEYQLFEALAWGADAVLLVVGALPAVRLRALGETAAALALAAIVEVHDERELDVALAADATLIGINNRNLEDFSVDVERTFELLDRIPAGRTVVSESGILTAEHVARLARAGVDAVLVGEVLMRADDPETACRALLER